MTSIYLSIAVLWLAVTGIAFAMVMLSGRLSRLEEDETRLRLEAQFNERELEAALLRGD